MATLEDAAEELVVRLNGLDSEIEESQQTLQELRGRVQRTSKEIEQEWSALTEAVRSFLERLREEQEQLAAEVQEALQAKEDASGAVRQGGGEARSEIEECQSDLEALSQHATGLDPRLESLVAEGGEAPAQGLAERAQEVEQELSRVLDEAREFLQAEVATALDELAADVRERCQALREELAEEGTEALQAAFEEWLGKADELEELVSAQGFIACRENARVFVDWALEECKTASAVHLEGVDAVVEQSVRPLQELAGAVQQAGTAVAAGGSDLVEELERSRDALRAALSVLGSVRDVLATFTFVQI